MRLTAEHVSHNYDLTEKNPPILVDISVDIASGQTVALMGPSGSGKSTLLSLLGLLHKLQTGVIKYDGRSVQMSNQEEQNVIGWVFQGSNALMSRTVVDNIAIGAMAKGEPYAAAVKTAKTYATRVGISHRLGVKTSTLSGGELQRLSIARALVGRPKIVFADEPTGQLDVRTARAVIESLIETKDQMTTVIVATHDQSVAAKFDRCLHIVGGRLSEK